MAPPVSTLFHVSGVAKDQLERDPFHRFYSILFYANTVQILRVRYGARTVLDTPNSEQHETVHTTIVRSMSFKGQFS